MKRFLLFFAVGLICSLTVFSQPLVVNENAQSCNVPSDFDFSKIYVKPIEHFSKANKLLSSNDTLNDHYLRATQFVTYAVNIQGNNYPLTGTNPIYYFLGEKFPVTTSGSIEGILIAVSFKVVGTMEDSLVVSVYNSGQTNGLPDGAPIGNQVFFLENLDTNLTSPKFSYINFDNPVNYSGPFVVMVLTRSVRVNNNGYVVFSNQHGDGANQERCCVLIYTQNGWVSANLGSIIQLQGVPIDIDPMIIPIVNTGTSGVNYNISFNSFSLEKIILNNNQTNLNIGLSSFESNLNLSIAIVDLKGNIVLEKKFENYASAQNTEIDLDVSHLVSGNYFCIINSGKDKIATKFNIVR
jgi:hypothetical protein